MVRPTIAILVTVVLVPACTAACPAPATPTAPVAAAVATPPTEPPSAEQPPSPPHAPREVVRRHNHLIEHGPYTIEVDATDGGRVVAFSLEGQNALVSRAESPEAYGSSFWPSPQADWQWPPPPAFAALAWHPKVDGAALVLRSEVAAKLELAAMQRLEAEPTRGLLRIDFTLENRGATPRRVAPWQNSRVPPGGIAVYPSTRPSYDFSSLKLEPRGGIVWYTHHPERVQDSLKSLADGDEGWVAYVNRGLVFVKLFPDVPPAAQAPGEGEVVLFVDRAGCFVEIEQQGAYVSLAPGAGSTWTVHWIVRRLPAEVAAEEGNPALLGFVRELVRAARAP